MPRSTRSVNRQTKLSFSPVPSSSPVASKLSKEAKDRAAAVVVESSPTKRRKVAVVEEGSDEDNEVQEIDEVAKTLPTPSRSSQLPARRSTRSTRKQQGRLDFSKHIGGSVEKTPSPSAGKTRKLRATKPSTSAFGRTKAVVELSSSSEESELEIEPVPTKTLIVDGSNLISRRKTEPVQSDDGDNNPPSRSTRQSRKNKKSYVELSDSDDDRDANITKKNGLPDFVEDESSGDEPMRSSPTKKPRRLLRRKERASSFINDHEEEEDDEDDIPITPRRRQSKTRPGYKESESDDENMGKANELESDENEEEDEDVVVSTRRRRPQTTPNRKLDRQAQEDLAEDLEFLQSSPPATSGKLRSTAPSKMTAKQKALEALKRRRQGQASTSGSSDEGSEPEAADANEDNGTPQEVDDLEDDVEDFIIEDDENDIIGAPAQLPLQFSMQASAKPKELFKHIVEWMVQKKINPAFSSKDEIYTLAFSRVDDEVMGLAGSKYKSSAWKRDFIVALSARPHIHVTAFEAGERDILDVTGCEACGRKSHQASFQITFEGKPYDKSTLEDIDNGDSDSNFDAVDEETPEIDAQSRPVPPAQRSWNVGSFCKGNAEIAHTLEHWRFHLNEWIIDWLDEQKYLTQEEVFKRDNWSTKKKRKYANEIVDEMEQRGEVLQLYRDFRGQVDSARESKNEYRRWF